MTTRVTGPSLALCLLAAPAVAEMPVVVADIAPVHGLVSMVMEGVGTPTLIVDQNASPHSQNLKPSAARALAEADAVIWIGPELTPWLGARIEALGSNAAAVALLEIPGTIRHEFRQDAAFDLKHASAEAEGHGEHAHDEHDHGEHGHGDDEHAEHGHAEHGHDEHGHGDHGHDEHDQRTHDDHAHDDHGHDEHGHDDHGHDDHGHDHGKDHGHSHDGTNPHAWLDPRNATTWLEAIAARLSEIDPANAAIYAANAEAAAADIARAEAEAAERLAPLADRGFIVFHDSMQYFERRFGLRALGAVSAGDAESPSAARMSELRAHLAEQGPICAFAEPQFDPRLLDAVTEGSPVRAGMVDPIGADIPLGTEFYPALIGALASGFADCLEELPG